MRRIELGAIRLYFDSMEEAVAVLSALVRHLTNKEAATMLGVSERTVRRWKGEGRLTAAESGGALTLADLLQRHVAAAGRPAGLPDPP